MLLDFDNIKVPLENGRIGFFRVCKATKSNKVNWIMRTGVSFKGACKIADNWPEAIVTSHNK